MTFRKAAWAAVMTALMAAPGLAGDGARAEPQGIGVRELKTPASIHNAVLNARQSPRADRDRQNEPNPILGMERTEHGVRSFGRASPAIVRYTPPRQSRGVIIISGGSGGATIRIIR